MTIRELIDLAKLTTLGSYAMKDDDEAVVTLLNFSLSQVYARIPILTQIQAIPLVKNKTRYNYLAKAYSRPLVATTEEGHPLVINDDTDHLSLSTLGNHVLDIPILVQQITNRVILTLQVKPPKISCTDIDIVDFSPDDALIPAILSYMAYLVSKNISEENGVGFLQEFEMQINEVKTSGIVETYHHSRTNTFKMNGWI